MTSEVTYYLILDRLIGKEEDGRYYLYQDGTWIPDIKSVIMDRLVGYDPYEPPGSPYGFGSGSVMDEIEKITYEQAMDRIGGLK